MNDTILLNTGMKLLIEHLGLVEAERFVYLMNKERFDYTQWHGVLSEGKTVEEISAAAMKRRPKEKRIGEKIGLPVYYLSDLVGLAMGLTKKDLAIDKHFVKV